MRKQEFCVGDRVSIIEEYNDLPLYNPQGTEIGSITLSPDKALRISKIYNWDSSQFLNLETEPGIFVRRLPAGLFALTINVNITIRKNLIEKMFNNLL